MAQKKKTQTTENLLSDLSNWASANALQSNEIVRSLSNDISTGKNLEIWADLDPSEYLPQAELIRSNKTWQNINSLSTFRNILVFSPVALTWASISVATTALTKFEKENPDSVTNFLQFWQQGFGYLDSFWLLSNVALFDVGLVAVIIFLTSVIGVLSKKAIEKELIEQETLDAQRATIILKLRIYLYEYKKPTINQINRQTYLATKSLASVVKRLTSIVAKLESDIKKYPNNKKVLSEIKQLETKISKLKKS